MRMCVRAKSVLLALLLASSACAEGPPAPASPDSGPEALAQACRYLWSRQGPDGGWHSDTYALFASGQALTPFVLHALLQAPPTACPPPVGGVARALQFIRRHANGAGALGVGDGQVLEYPNYATAYALRSLVRAGEPRDLALIGRMRGYLAGQQYHEGNGFPATEPAHGGWGFGGTRRPGEPGHMDLAHTRHVLDALAESGQPDPATLARAQRFLRLLQKDPSGSRPQPLPPGRRAAAGAAVLYDGGFYFSPVVLAANKAGFHSGEEGAGFRSYASATCDGLLALLAAGVEANDGRVLAARRWLERHPRWDYSEGIPEDQAEDWGRALLFYHLAVRAEAYQRLGWPGSWRDDLAAVVLPEQQSDGSFQNRDNHLMKEDDPLLATALAVSALSQSFAAAS